MRAATRLPVTASAWGHFYRIHRGKTIAPWSRADPMFERTPPPGQQCRITRRLQEDKAAVGQAAVLLSLGVWLQPEPNQDLPEFRPLAPQPTQLDLQESPLIFPPVDVGLWILDCGGIESLPLACHLPG